MRLSLVLSMALTLKLFSATTYSQQTKLSLDLENTTLKELLKEIGKTTEFSFWYSNDVFDDNHKVTLSIKDVTIDKVLDLALKDQDLTYDIMDKVILIYKSAYTDRMSSRQQLVITGTVTDATTNEPLPGVNILIEGTLNGTITKANGEYRIEVPGNNTVLVFSSIGYVSEKISIDGKSVIDVSLSPDVVSLKEVVVTALGISREKKTLTYATRSVSGSDLSNSREINITSALQGKVAGININSTNSGPGGSSRLVLRGDKSIKGNNQPLIVLDGVPIDNTADANAETSYGIRDNGDGLSNINSDDIESMTVLPGPAAAALYGSAASNGVIIINTKKGTGTKQGLGVQVTSSLMLSDPMVYPKFQNAYGQGTGSAFQSNSEYSWGPKMTGQMVTHWTGKQQPLTSQPDNFKDFFRTGADFMNTLAITSGHTYFSYTNTTSKGIIPNNKYVRNNFNIRETFELTKGLTVDTKLTYLLEDDINRQSTGMRNYAVCSLYQMPRSIRLGDVRNFESIVNNERVQNYWNPGSFTLQNPYWTVYRNLYERTRRRFLGMVSLKYQLTQALSVQVRGSADYYNDFSEEKDYNNSYWVETPGQGNYITEDESNRFLTADALITYVKDLTPSINLNLNAGASIETTDFKTSISNNKGLVAPNVFSSLNAVGIVPYIYNIEPMMSKTEKQSVYGAAQIGFKNYLFLNVTARNDWNSTLPPDNLSYFYPSFGANAILSEMFKLPKAISFLKIRGTYAIVGNGTGFDNYRKNKYDMRPGGNSIFTFSDGTLYLEDLKPEITRSWEGGLELNLWKNRFGLDFALYSSNTDNQILSIPMPSTSGYLSRIINAGEIENKGVELTMNGKPLVTNNFTWDIGITFSKNVNKIVELSPENEKLVLVMDHIANVTAYVGDKFNDLWVSDFSRDDQGRIIVDNSGIPLITDKEYYAGNANPDWRAGILNTISFKDFSLSALIDIRQGGVILSHTEALLSSMGCSERTLANREADFIVPNSVFEDGTPNNIPISAETYWKVVGGGDPVGRLFTYDASNIRLRELSLTYTLPKKLVDKSFIKEASFSLLGRNLFFISNKTEGVDPEAASVGTGNAQGIEYCSNPTLRSYGFQLRLNF